MQFVTEPGTFHFWIAPIPLAATGGAAYLAKAAKELAPSGAVIATVIGRYYAMDRDKRWSARSSHGTPSSSDAAKLPPALRPRP